MICCPTLSRVWRKSHTRGGVGRNVPFAVGHGSGEGQSINRKLEVLLPNGRSANPRVERRTRVTGLSHEQTYGRRCLNGCLEAVSGQDRHPISNKLCEQYSISVHVRSRQGVILANTVTIPTRLRNMQNNMQYHSHKVMLMSEAGIRVLIMACRMRWD